MKQPPVFVTSIRQKDNHSFIIEWGDRVSQTYRLSELQRRCPCANCHDPSTGRQIQQPQEQLADDVRAVRITSVGRYALRIQFTKGCSLGIYSYAMLRELGKNA